MNKKQKILLITLIPLIAILGFIAYYSNDYYRAMPDIKEIYAENENLFFDNANNELGFIIYPGGKVEEVAYAPLANELNDAGYKVAIAEFPIKLGILDTDYAGKIIREYPSVESWVIVGHSLGGTSASIYVANDYNPQISGLVFLGSYTNEDLKDLPTKTISIIGTNDTVLNFENLKKTKQLYNSEHIFYDIDGGNHAYFAYYGEQKGDGTALITRETQIDLTVQYILENFGIYEN